AADLRWTGNRHGPLHGARWFCRASCSRRSLRTGCDGLAFFHRETLKRRRIRTVLVDGNSALNFVRQRCTRNNFSTVNRRTCRMQFSTESVAVTVLSMVSFSVRVRSRFPLRKIRLRQRRLVRRKSVMMSGAAGGKENKGDETRQ